MLILIHLVMALVITLVIGLVFITGLRRSGPFPGVIGFLLLILLVAWSGGIWMTPFGPELWGVAFIPFALAGLLAALILAAFTPPREGSTVHLQTRTEKMLEEKAPGSPWSLLLLSLVLILVLAIVAHYLVSSG
jgi:hypothetical protein